MMEPFVKIVDRGLKTKMIVYENNSLTDYNE